MASGASGRVRSAANASVRTPWAEVRSAASFWRRSMRRAVSTKLAPPAASCSASAQPIPALAPVTKAHLPFQRSMGRAVGVLLEPLATKTLRFGASFAEMQNERTPEALHTMRKAIRPQLGLRGNWEAKDCERESKASSGGAVHAATGRRGSIGRRENRIAQARGLQLKPLQWTPGPDEFRRENAESK